MRSKAKKLAITCALLTSGIVTNAHAQMYFGGNIGLAMLTKSEVTDTQDPDTAEIGFKDDVTVAGLAGYTFNDNFRIEGEVAYQENNVKSFGMGGVEVDASMVNEFRGEATNLTWLLNGYYDFLPNGNFKPYLTAGIGRSKVNIEFRLEDPSFGVIAAADNDSSMTYHVGIGMGYILTENITLDLRYRYLVADDLEFDTSSMDYASHNITGGIRVSF